VRLSSYVHSMPTGVKRIRKSHQAMQTTFDPGIPPNASQKRYLQNIILGISNRKSWSSVYHTCFVFGRSRVQISAQIPATLTEIFRDFIQSLQMNADIVPGNYAINASFQIVPIHNLLITLSFYATYSLRS
jgi:hypothetical protein